MSKSSKEAALKAYPKEIRDKSGFVIDIGHPQWTRDYYIEGYEQAEKDLALTWEDVKKIQDLCMEVTTFFAMVGRNKVILEPPFYEEVARRFNKQRKEE